MSAPTAQLLLTVSEAATTLRVARSTAYELMARGDLHWVQVGAHRRITAAEIARFIAENTRASA